MVSLEVLFVDGERILHNNVTLYEHMDDVLEVTTQSSRLLYPLHGVRSVSIIAVKGVDCVS